MYIIQYNEDKLKIIGALLPFHSGNKGGTLLQVLDMLEDVDLLRLAHTSRGQESVVSLRGDSESGQIGGCGWPVW